VLKTITANFADQERIQQDLYYWYGATPAQPGGYDPRANPNFHGNDDAPPGMTSP
jgi:hypothetical protein